MLNNNKAFVYFICSVSAMGGLLFGYDWVVIGGAKPFYESFFGIAGNTWLQGVAMSTALVGCLIGAMVAGALADRYGRKPLLTTAAVLFTVSAIGTGLTIVLFEALLRTLVFAIVAYVGIRRMHISSEVDNILRLKK